MRYKGFLILIAICSWLMLIGCCRGESIENAPNTVDTSQMELMYTTAYCLEGTTATGGTTRPGIAACNPHLGDIAMIYTLDGSFLGMYEVTDTGATEGLKNGTVIDVWKANYTHCKGWMKVTGGRVYVLWIHGEG